MVVLSSGEQPPTNCSRIPAHRASDPDTTSDKKSKKRSSYKGLGGGARRPLKPTPRHAAVAVVLAAALVIWLSLTTAVKPADKQVCQSAADAAYCMSWVQSAQSPAHACLAGVHNLGQLPA